MSLCDRCFLPGACCKGMAFHFDAANAEPDPIKADALMRQHALARKEILPFVVMQRVHAPEGGVWRWRCTALTGEGRCSIYDDRPAICRTFEPAMHRLCVHWQGAESGDPTVAL